MVTAASIACTLPRGDMPDENVYAKGASEGASLIEIPIELRQWNYYPYKQGSCVHASTIVVLRHAGEYDKANYWRGTYHSGEPWHGIVNKLEREGVRYAYTRAGDMRFLEWAIRNRRAAGIFYFKTHAVNLVGLDDNYAYLLDNESPSETIKIERETFAYNWRNKYGGFAWTVLYSVPPPFPEQ